MAGFKIPKSLAACADAYFLKREDRLAKEKEAAALKAEEEMLKQHLIDNLPKSEATGIAGKLAQVSRVEKDVPKVVNWEDFYKHILKTKDFSFLNKAVNRAAVKERWDEGKSVPGVEHFTDVTLSIHRLK